MNKKQFIRELVNELSANNLAIFAGAGLSVAAGFVDWKGLLKDLAEELDLDIDKEENDLISLAQYYINEKQGNRSKINQIILNEFSHQAVLTENHKILARLPIDTFWTTNYDSMIENALKDAGKVVDIKHCIGQLPISIHKRDAVVYKMHGDASLPDQTVLIKDDYETYQDKKELFATALRGDLLSKTFLFIGFSFDDPNLEYILGRIKVLLKDNTPTHYCFFKEVSRDDFHDDESYMYAKVKQELKIEDLIRYGIHSIMIQEYSDITAILKEIERLLKRSNIFISGAAHSYSPFSEEKAKELIHNLSYKLAEEEYKIISGYGLGIGSIVINGALEYKYQSNYRNLDDLLILRPFPQIQSGDKSISERWTDYRNEIISQAGIAIFMFGNKLDKNGEIVLSNGMKEEFEICLQHNVIPIPIGCTGSISEELWDDVIKNRTELYFNDQSLINEIKKLGQSDISNDEIISTVLSIINKLQKM